MIGYFAQGALWVFILGCVFTVSPSAYGQYWPRGTSYNDHFYPNIDEPDKFLLTVDTMVDLQREYDESGARRLILEDYHFQGRFYFGGRKFRGGVLIAHDLDSRDVKDLSLGLGAGFSRPFFFDIGAAYLMRNDPLEDQEGLTVNGQFGYEIRMVYQVKYRVRFRVLGNVMYKRINTTSGPVNSVEFFPMVGIDFET